MREFNPEDFIVRFPGQYDEKETEALNKWWAAANAINTRKGIDVNALINGTLPKDTPGIGPVVKVSEEMIKYNHSKYEQENPLFNDAEYAKKAGYLDIPAYITFATHDDTYTCAFPPEARDTLLVSQASHWVESYQPVYAGDTMYLVIDERQMIDLTPPEGSVYRTTALYNSGTIYNQRGEVVNKVGFHYCESVKTYKPGKKPENLEALGFAGFWEDPDWCSKEDHYYTDEDYEYIKEVWKKEKIRGAEPLYWEDVNVGDEPAHTMEGPILACANPTAPYGNGTGGARTMKKEILDDEIVKTMIKDNHGILKLQNEADYIPEIPAEVVNSDLPDSVPAGAPGTGPMDVDTADIHGVKGDERAAIINFYGRDLATHCINNYIGDQGRIFSLKWSIMPPETHAAFGKPVPESPYYVHWIEQAPKMKDRHVECHGLTRDTAEVCSEVVDKYIKNGRYLVKLIWWIQDINQKIWINGCAEVELPHKAN